MENTSAARAAGERRRNGVERARAFAKRLNAGLGIIDKRRDEPNKAKAMNVIGDVRDRNFNTSSTESS